MICHWANVGDLLSSTELSQRYRALDQAQKDEYIKRGRVATQHPNQSRGSSFGLRTRDFDRLQQKRVQQAASRALVPIGPALQSRRASTGDICDDAIKFFLADVGSIPHGQLLPTARAMVRAQQQLHDVHRQQCIRRLELWQATSEFQVLDLASKLLPGLSLHLRNFTATPSLSDICLEYVPHLDGSASVARACILQSHKSNLARALDLDWAGKHMPVMHTSMPLIVESKQEKAAVSKTSSCKEVGFCVCNPSGKRIGKLRSGFYLHLKGLCKPKSPGIQIIRFTNLPPSIFQHNIITGVCSTQCKSIAVFLYPQVVFVVLVLGLGILCLLLRLSSFAQVASCWRGDDWWLVCTAIVRKTSRRGLSQHKVASTLPRTLAAHESQEK